MTEFRSRILQSKQNESSLIATSRKRKLRELYAVADCDGPVPYNWVVNHVDHPPPAPTPSAAEALFLEHNDILQNRYLDESSIPTRRQLRSYTTKGIVGGRKALDSHTPDISRLSSKGSREDVVKKSRGTTPAKDFSDKPPSKSLNGVDPSRESRSTASTVEPIQSDAIKASSKVSEPDSHSSSDVTLDAGIDEPMIDAPRPPSTKLPETLGPESLEQDRIRTEVESIPGSPGVDPRKAVPISAEDAAQLSEPLISGAQDEHHKAAVAHLPPQDVQEDRLHQVNERRAERLLEKENDNVGGGLAISLPASQSARTSGEPVSSPGSTIEANSATTPALHEASTDTSPENEGPRYDADKSEGKTLQPETPPELAPSKEEVLEKEEHDRLLKAQIEVARAEILASSPAAVDAQLRLEEEQAAAASSKDTGREVPDSEKSVSGSSQDASIADSEEDRSDRKSLTKSTGEVAQDIVEDEEDEVVGVPTPDDGRVPDLENTAKHTSAVDQAIDADHMDVDIPADEKESKATDLESRAAQSLAADMNLEISGPTAKQPASRKDFSSHNTSTSTPRRTPVLAPTPPTVERMTTRVSSGAMRHKSVSEILGEIPRPNTAPTSERPAASKITVDNDSTTDSNPQSRASTPQSSASRIRTMVERAKEKERSKLSTVVFAKQPSDRPSNKSAIAASGSRAKDHESAAYFMPLIVHQAYQNTRGVQPLDQLLMSAHKTITTSNAHVTFRDHQTTKVLRRIHSLQLEGKWSFRQPKRSPEPNRPTAHWDELLKEAKWMRTDFREERKWKMAVARTLAGACVEWVEADENDRKLLQVNAFIPPADSTQRISNIEPKGDSVAPVVERSHSTPELEASRENESPADEFDEEPRASMLDAVAPGVMFTTHFDDLVFPLSNSLATNKLLENLPLWGPQFKHPQSDLPTSDVDPDASWRRPALPLSKFATGQIVLKSEGPPRKRSRYEYEYEDEEDDQGLKRAILEPALRDVALFNPENKHIRDRIHSSHQFRPPSENPMPLQSFFECRMSSQWTWAEDDELKQLVREYSYNWQLISNMLSSRSLFSSSAERRTPWECFERWIHLEGLPADMQKTHYFRAYNNRLEAAQRNVMAQAVLPPQQANAAGAAITPVRRRTTTSVRVERRRNQKHLTLVDAMRKLAKKRETSLQKQQHAAGLAAMRKANEAAQPPPPQRYTPQEFSRLKHERELQIMERMQRHQMQQETARKALQQGRTGQQQNPQQFPNGVPQQPRMPPSANAVPSVNVPPNANRPNQLAIPGQNLPHAQMQVLPNGIGTQVPLTNGHGPIPQIPLKVVPQAQMQGMPGMPGMQGLPPQHRMPAPNPAPDIRMVMQARQISEQQRQAVQMQQQGQTGQIHNSPPNMRSNMSGMNQQAFMQNNQAIMAAFNSGNMNGVSTPPNGLNVPGAGSPRMAHPGQSQQPNGSVSQISKLEASCRAQYPTASPEHINKFVRDALSQNLAVQRQSAMHAAAGSGTPLAGIPAGMQSSPQQYAQMLRAQQERQAANVNHQQRSASAGSGSATGK